MVRCLVVRCGSVVSRVFVSFEQTHATDFQRPRKPAIVREGGRTEIIVWTERGSASFISDLVPSLNILAIKMSGPESMITILGLALIVGTTYVAKRWIDARRDVALADVQQRINEQDAVKLQAIEKLIAKGNGA